MSRCPGPIFWLGSGDGIVAANHHEWDAPEEASGISGSRYRPRVIAHNLILDGSAVAAPRLARLGVNTGTAQAADKNRTSVNRTSIGVRFR